LNKIVQKQLKLAALKNIIQTKMQFYQIIKGGFLTNLIVSQQQNSVVFNKQTYLDEVCDIHRNRKGIMCNFT
jgi:hypothetical protein